LTKLKNKNAGSKYDDEDTTADVPEEKDEKETTGDEKSETASSPDTASYEVGNTDGLLDDLPIRTSSRHGNYMDSDADEYAVNRH